VTTKTFDCVEMMHDGARRIRAELAGLTPDEVRAYWEAATAALLARQAAYEGGAQAARAHRRDLVQASESRSATRRRLTID
jgi:hypothetical protein